MRIQLPHWFNFLCFSLRTPEYLYLCRGTDFPEDVSIQNNALCSTDTDTEDLEIQLNSIITWEFPNHWRDPFSPKQSRKFMPFAYVTAVVST